MCIRDSLSTDGKLVTCLFATGGIDLKTPMRSGATDSELTNLITSSWNVRQDRYSEERSTNQTPDASKNKIEMFHIGG